MTETISRRAISHWFTWEDLDFPNPEIEQKIERRAATAAAAGVNLAIFFGFHFRWDFICCFETLHALLKFTANAYHRYGITVMDHHSAVLTHRPRGPEGRRDTFFRNHHHVPLTLDASVAGQLQYEGSFLNSWRQQRIDDGSVLFLENYQAESYCSNNPDFRRAYFSYVQRLFAETGVDGLMADDFCIYGQWAACGCRFCREKFRELTGCELPPGDDTGFWGNYDHPGFRSWVAMRYDNTPDFFAQLRKSLPRSEEKLFTSCCSASTAKRLDANGMDMSHWSSCLNLVMLEMCGEISGGKHNLSERVPDILLHHSISERRKIPCLGMGYAFYPDSAFLVWSLNCFFGSDSWISSLKGRLGGTSSQLALLPDEPELVQQPFLFEARHPQLFGGRSIAPAAVWYSHASKVFNGDSPEDYQTGFETVVRELHRHNIAFVVTDEIPSPSLRPILIAVDCDCVSGAERKALDDYLAAGGVLIACGRLGGRDQSGATAPEGGYLEAFGFHPELPATPRQLLPAAQFFEPWQWPPSRKLPGATSGNRARFRKIHWYPERMQNADDVRPVRQLLEELIKLPLEISVPETLNYRICERSGGGGKVVHFMPVGISAQYHSELKNRKTGEFVVRSIDYAPLKGELQLRGAFTRAILYSVDRTQATEAVPRNGAVTFPLDGLRRFFSVELFDESVPSSPSKKKTQKS